MDSVYRGWVGGREVGWALRADGKLKAGYTISVQRQSCCVFNEAQKQPQCTCQAKTVIGSSLTSHTALLVLPSGTV